MQLFRRNKRNHVIYFSFSCISCLFTFIIEALLRVSPFYNLHSTFEVNILLRNATFLWSSIGHVTLQRTSCVSCFVQSEYLNNSFPEFFFLHLKLSSGVDNSSRNWQKSQFEQSPDMDSSSTYQICCFLCWQTDKFGDYLGRR